MSEHNTGNQQPFDDQVYRDTMLGGRTPQKYLAEHVERNRKLMEDLKKSGHVATDFGVYDVADVVIGDMHSGIVTREEAQEAIGDLGLTPEQQAVFFTETIPEFERLTELAMKQDAAKAEQRQTERYTTYGERWGLDRIDGIVDYMEKNVTPAMQADPNWQRRIAEYKAKKVQTGEMLATIQNPRTKASILMRTLYGVTYMQPSEALTIHDAERRTDSFAYSDSLIGAVEVFHETDDGKDPDFEKFDLGSGLSLQFYSAADPASMKRAQRRDAVDSILLGAKTPNEVFIPGKQSFPVARPPETPR